MYSHEELRVRVRYAQQLRVAEPEPKTAETVEAFWLRVARIEIHRCPDCGGTLRHVADLPPVRGPP